MGDTPFEPRFDPKSESRPDFPWVLLGSNLTPYRFRMVQRGFAIEATTPAERAQGLARDAEGAGYASIWSNDLPHADGLSLALTMGSVTSSIDTGVGVIPLDRRPPADIESALHGADLARLVLGIGAGFSEHPLAIVKGGVGELRAKVRPARLAIAAMGPQMCRLAGRLGDMVLLNWMTPERIAWARRLIDDGARDRSEKPRIAAYVRVAAGPGAEELLREAESHYRQMPHYARHFDAMGAEPGRVGISHDHANAIKAYEAVLDDVMIRPLGPNIEEILQLMSPSS
jgi:alkanesulfonate monooxygenase SsuD/methylene tetrahydromethanopterin reductase-like flavin-dependent oxidoreductase (luciferase family)